MVPQRFGLERSEAGMAEDKANFDAPWRGDEHSQGDSLVVERSPMPLYHRVYVVLRDRIVAGAYPEGALLPSEREITAAFEVSRITAKRALDELAAEGFVERARGRGTRVLARPTGRTGQRPLIGSIDGLRENLAAMGRSTSVRLLEFEYVAPSPEVQARLGVGPDEVVQRAVRVRSLDGVPLSLSTTFVPERIGRAYGPEDLESTPLIDLLEGTGVRVGLAEQSLNATLADPLAASRLHVSVGSPLLLMNRTIIDVDGRPVQYIQMRYRPDRFEYRMTLTRDQAAGHGRFPPTAQRRGSQTKKPRSRPG